MKAIFPPMGRISAQIVKLNPAHYARRAAPTLLSTSTTAGRRTLVSPDDLALELDGYARTIPSANIDMNTAANWDSTATDYTVAAARAGLNFYMYATVNGLILSANSTVPTGYTSSNSRKICGYHCVPADIVGVSSSHGAYGFLVGDIAPPSIWDLIHRPVSAPEGMCWDSNVNLWVDAWLQSGTGGNTASVMGATITDTREQYNHARDFSLVNKRMLNKTEFELTAIGSPEVVNIASSADPGVTGATLTTTGVSQVSNKFCWQMTGVMFQWCIDNLYRNDDASYLGTWSWKSTGGAGSQYTQGSNGAAGLHAGGYWAGGGACGTRCILANSVRTALPANCSSRGCAPGISTKG